jgi:tetratricopeptide (TPR) repeat protein
MVDVDALWEFDDPAGSAARFRELQAEVLTQRARAAGLQRRFEEAEGLLGEADALAATARVRARVLLERGRVRNTSGDPAAARPLFLAALEVADDEALRIDAAHMLGIVDEASWTERALAMAEASQEERARRWRGSLLNNLGWARHDAGRLAEALELFEQALAERRARGTARQAQIARWCVGRCLRSLGRLEEALAIQEALADEVADDRHVRDELAELRRALGRG